MVKKIKQRTSKTITLPDDMWDDLQASADTNLRSLTREVEAILIGHLAGRGAADSGA